jgi:hypothetical protein
LIDMKRACGCQDEEGTQFAVRLQEGLWGEVGLETQGGPLALCRHFSANHLFCILSMMAWLSDS